MFCIYGTCMVLLVCFLSGGGKAPTPLSEVAIAVEGILGADNASIGGITAAPRHDAIFTQIR